MGNLGLKTLPEDLFFLRHLQHLNLGDTTTNAKGAWIFAASDIAPNALEADLERLSELPELKALSLAGSHLSSLSCITALNFLQTLYCGRTEVSNLFPLIKFGELQTLGCSALKVDNLSSLANLYKLKELYLNDTQVGDLSPLSGLRELQKLFFVSSPVNNLSPLAGLTNLQVLNCSDTQVSDLSPLANLSALQELYCSLSYVSDLTPLVGLTNLQVLNCSETRVDDLSPLASLLTLRRLMFYSTRVSDLSPLKRLLALQKLGCYDTHVIDLSPLADLSELQELECFDNQVSDLSPLAGLPALQTLLCFSTRVNDLSPLANLPALQELDCSSSRVTDLSPLAGLVTLKMLMCYETQVSDLSPLAGLLALQKFMFFTTKVSDLSPLAGLTALQTLSCSDTQVSDLSPLAGLSMLQSLNIAGTHVTDLSPLVALPELGWLNCSYCSLSYVPEGLLNYPILEELVFFKTNIPGIPAEILSSTNDTNCLESLRAHFRDLKFGAEAIADVKLMVLGNGRIGKTQICRRLQNDDYDPQVSSTHGIVVRSVLLPFPSSGKEPPWLHLWDFGGQDIYHGTHALFMRTRAIFMLVWIPEAEGIWQHEHEGMIFRNQPLSYWLAYIHHMSGLDSPVIVMQTRCDRPEDEVRRLPIGDEVLEKFRFCKLLQFSSKENRGRAALDDTLREAIIWLREQQGTTLIGKGRLRVKQRLEALRDADTKAAPEQRQYRTLSQEHFRQLCAEGDGDVSSPEYLLEYLHNAGLIFHRKGLFQDRIILDQGWALEAVYAVFQREKCYKQLGQLRGRFTRSLLELLVWQKHEKEEQELFLGMMQSCGICFVHREGSSENGTEDEYIAPDLLPRKAEVDTELEEKWDPEAPTEKVVFEYELHHPSLLRSFVSLIGSEAGINALYWKDGVCLYEKTTRSRALIEQKALDGWRGTICLSTQGGHSAALLAQLKKKLMDEQERWGVHSEEWAEESVGAMARQQPRPDPAKVALAEPVSMKLEFIQEPETQPQYCISYAWRDMTEEGREREVIVDRLLEEAKVRGIRILYDKSALGLGERISKFMKRIGQADRVFVVLSDKYLKSPHCMFELFEIWRNSQQEEDEFLRRIRIYTLPGTKIFSPLDRAKCAIYWKKQREELRSVMDESGLDSLEILGKKDFQTYKLMLDFAHHVSDILATMADIVQPQSFEELAQYGLSDIV